MDILDPVKTWSDKQGFETTAKKLVGMFRKNFVKFEANVDSAVKAAQTGEPSDDALICRAVGAVQFSSRRQRQSEIPGWVRRRCYPDFCSTSPAPCFRPEA